MSFAPELDETMYADSYKIRKAASTMTSSARLWLCENSEMLIDQSISSSDRTSFSVLSIGCGDGDIDIEFLKTLSNHFAKKSCHLEYICLEPNACHRDIFLQRLSNMSLGDHVSIEVHKESFGYSTGFSSLKRYNLILISHVLYYFKYPDVIIKSALSLTKPSGNLLIIHQTSTGIPQIQKKIMQKIKGNENELFTTDEIHTILSHAGYSYTYEDVDAQIDVTECLHQTEQGIAMMSFCLECNLTHQDHMAMALKEFSSLAQKSNDGRYIIREPIGIFTIPSQKNRCDSIFTHQDDTDPVNDYRILAQHYDWQSVFHAVYQHHKMDSIHILDVACGTGRWLQAFQFYTLPLLNAQNKSQFPEIHYHLLDPSKESLAKANDRLGINIKTGEIWNIPFQEMKISSNNYHIIWVMHGFYAMPRNDLRMILCNMSKLLTDNGVAIIAQANRHSFYIDFYEHFKQCFNMPYKNSFVCAEEIVETLSELGLPYHITFLDYHECIERNNKDHVSHYLLKESIDNSFVKENEMCDCLMMDDLLRAPNTNHYIENCIAAHHYQFPQNVWVIKFSKQ